MTDDNLDEDFPVVKNSRKYPNISYSSKTRKSLATEIWTTVRINERLNNKIFDLIVFEAIFFVTIIGEIFVPLKFMLLYGERKYRLIS